MATEKYGDGKILGSPAFIDIFVPAFIKSSLGVQGNEYHRALFSK